MPTIERKFDFHIDPSFYPSSVNEIPQYCNVRYKIDIFSKKVFVSVSGVLFSVWQLNYVQWSPKMMAEMRSAAIDHYKATKEKEEPDFVEESI